MKKKQGAGAPVLTGRQAYIARLRSGETISFRDWKQYDAADQVATEMAFFATPDGYSEMVHRWSEWMNDSDRRPQLDCAHHLLYLALRGKNWEKALTPVTNRIKLDNGAMTGWIGRCAVRSFHADRRPDGVVAPFADLLSHDAMDRLRLLVPFPTWNEDVMAREPYAEIAE